ncbi:MAG: 16S rRNA (cytidine(1402)-2'-O)-methyltransferase [Bacilli bacterium]|nr:16S rRNA (cytidine(1402)-2'-O)-methyltransferase [Bacilli bacterium]
MRRDRNFEGNEPLLYLIATPIGNLSEFSPRAIEVITSCDYVACEDTRNTGMLLKHFSIQKKLISCHEHNENETSEKIISLIKEGNKIAYVSDAGYPVISDPGQLLAKHCIEAGIKVSIVNGPNAAICALVGSGLSSEHFLFYGFLSSKGSERRKELEKLTSFPYTMIFYEAPHRIDETLKDLEKAFGSDRKACLCRELTKMHEEFIRGTLGEFLEIDKKTLIGEFVIVIEGKAIEEKVYSKEEIISLLREELKSSSGRDAVANVVKITGLPKREVYDIYLKELNDK